MKFKCISAIRYSLSIELRVRVKKERTISLFRIISSGEDGSEITWLEILLNGQRNRADVLFMSGNMIPERTGFDLIGSHNTWITLLFTMKSGDDSTLSLALQSRPKQIRNLIDGISLLFPASARFYIGGTSSNSQGYFVVSNQNSY